MSLASRKNDASDHAQPDVADPISTDSTPAPASDPEFCCASKPAGRPRAADQEARLEHLLDTAGCLFLQHGYGKVSLESIAREAHVAVRTIYVKFGGKAGLFNAVVERRRSAYFSTMTAMDADRRPMQEILGDFALRFVRLINKPEAVRLNRMVVAEAEASPELALTFHKVGPGQTRELLIRFFSRPAIRSHFREQVPVDMLALHLINCLMGDQMSRLLFPSTHMPSDQESRRNAEQGLDLFFKGTLKS
ncbi:TetR/AcrR family transcriptional regulator [Janthinobacterium agaricidamnosum]|uniref:Bacterial regulatory s, tetR family protein n=1 Tax=Janthinobacterium agaricidamnosum NBRC 102515 = DSM 9628 TaxID=1349767 RepID=W0V298_9BURK|nr:TetR/AcrR family transcriptional regulator [Janthinobacterium agaricidamnosum]CDG81760.1 bacterial regulatory s, tetR family protein [Janthinobacterium agaricidamnosum NBRC 102515 = DSM 9628]